MPSAFSTATSAPRVKRPFQPSITNFFPRAEGHDTQYPTSAATPHPRSATPAVPAPIQASLLNVGMRVRKSVPEGYKTHKQLQTINTGSNVPTDVYSVKPPREPVPDEYQHPRELLPFCGLHKIGGYAEQPVTNTHLYGSTHTEGEVNGGSNRPVPSHPLIFPLPAEAFNIPFSSQDSSTSTSSSISTDSAPARNPNNKRTWSEDDAPPTLNTNFLFAHSIKEDEVPVSPLSSTPSQALPFGRAAASDPSALRPFAQPRTRNMRRQQTQMEGFDETLLKAQAQGMDIDLENAERPSDDFEEADFLRPAWGGEVEMGGV